MKWELIKNAPLHVREMAVEIYAKAGQNRCRIGQDTYVVDGRTVLRTYVFITGFTHGSPVTHWLDEELPELPL